MDMAYAAADLIISRAGAMTCYEILAIGKPAILVFLLLNPPIFYLFIFFKIFYGIIHEF